MAIAGLRLVTPATRPGALPGAALAGALVLVVLGATAVKGPVFGVGAAMALVLGVLLIASPRVSVALAVIAMIACEADPTWGVDGLNRLYDNVAWKLNPFELLELGAVVAVCLDCARTRSAPRLPGPLLPALILTLLAVAFGLINGITSDAHVRFAIISLIQTFSPLWLIPFLIVNVVKDTADLRRWITAAMAIALAKALAGIFVVLAGLAAPQIDGPALTYYEPAANLLLVAYVFLGLIVMLTDVKIPWWAWWGVPVAVACVVMSYRRTFWLTAIAIAPILVTVAAGRVGRRLLVPVVVVAAISGYVVIQAGALSGLSGAVIDRARSIDPAKVTRDNQDRYRIAERRNVVLEVKRHPLTGLGAGVGWRTSRPLNFDEGVGSRQFVHLALLWFWMKMGILGVASYLALIASGIWVGLSAFRRHPDGLVRAGALAVAGITAALVIVDLASTIVGPDERGTAMMALFWGLGAAALIDARAQPRDGAAAGLDGQPG